MKLAALVMALLTATPAAAAPLLHPMFADHAVLQRDQPIRVYGQSAPGTQVQVHLGGTAATVRAESNGQWSVTLPAMAAGGPYTLQVDGGGQSQQIQDVLVGDVFLCTGQSNMQLSVRRAANAEFEIAAATDGGVRELAVDRIASPSQLSSFTTSVSWKVETPQTAGDFSASCFFFARELRKHVHVPVGLITAAWGGTRERGWVSGASLRALNIFNDDLDMLALYQRAPEDASHRWDAAWESWWKQNSTGEPWKEDASSWPLAPQALGPWGEWPGLRLPEGTAEPGVGFVGQMWLSTHVSLTASQAAQSATLELGRANEEEKSWLNGRGIGGSSQQPNAVHALPRGILHPGDNSIVLNIFCSWKNCGLTGPASTRLIRFADGSQVMLDQPWRYKPVENLIAPQLPWGPMHGAGLQYNGMIAPIGPYGVKAAIWYQGESNIYFARHYQAGLTAMMTDWRRQFGAALPFLIVQIPDYGPIPVQPGESLWSDVREAQRQTVEADPHAALVVTFDIGDPKNLHPPNKQEIGRRLSIAARHLLYGEALAPSGARVAAARRSGDTVTVSFKDVTGSLSAYNGPPNAFELCDAGSCRWAHATLANNQVTLMEARTATRVRYCWGDSPVCTLTDASGLPAGPFEMAIQAP
ncbi:MAG TPA: sialate O-acetylesterase [Rhizomicrobium sp.]|nr:sialate O-acetylesterase [Rhizomicrobium sp.]